MGKALIYVFTSIAACMKGEYSFLIRVKITKEYPILGLEASIVLSITKITAKVTVRSEHTFYFDNFFTNLDFK